MQRVIIKTPREGGSLDPNELEIGKHLSDRAERRGVSDPKYNLIGPLQHQGKTVALISKFESCEFTAGSNESYSVEDAFRKLARNAGTQPSSNKIAQAFNVGLGTTLCQLSYEMYGGQAALHRAGVLHLDSAPRNFMLSKPKFDQQGNLISLSAKIIDYGLSKKSIEGGVDLSYMGAKMPVLILDEKGLNEFKGNISSDLFAIKTSMICMACFALGMEKDGEVLFFNDSNAKVSIAEARRHDVYEGPVNADGIGLIAPYGDDTKALKAYLDNAKEIVSTSKNVVVAEEAKLFLQCYEDYLLKMPKVESNQNKTFKEAQKEAQKEDKKMLLKANALFIDKSIEKKLHHVGPIEYLQKSKLEESYILTRRLLEIPVRERFKNSETYQNLTRLNSALEHELNSRALLSQFTAKSSDALPKPVKPNKWQEFNTRTSTDQIRKGNESTMQAIDAKLTELKSGQSGAPTQNVSSSQNTVVPDQQARTFRK